MFGKLLGPAYTLKDALLILEKGLRNGEITLNERIGEEARATEEESDLKASMNTLVVGNLGNAVTDFDLRTLFEPFGTVESAQIVLARDTDHSDRIGVVKMSSANEALIAIKALNDKEIHGQRLVVNPAQPR